jgi:hypothetical protein
MLGLNGGIDSVIQNMGHTQQRTKMFPVVQFPGIFYRPDLTSNMLPHPNSNSSVEQLLFNPLRAMRAGLFHASIQIFQKY